MKNHWMAIVVTVISMSLAGASVVSSQTTTGSPPENEKTIWKLEHDYFRFVEANDLKSYSGLWHDDFLGWPSVSPVPVHKDHITDWITAQTSKGMAFKLIEFKPASLQITENIGVVCYWVSYKFADKDGNGAPYTIRITHAWLKDGKDWRIIGGMSMPIPAIPPQ